MRPTPSGSRSEWSRGQARGTRRAARRRRTDPICPEPIVAVGLSSAASWADTNAPTGYQRRQFYVSEIPQAAFDRRRTEAGLRVQALARAPAPGKAQVARPSAQVARPSGLGVC